ncbi:hypothetical protein H4582DRAFT_2163084 [Lactarius indigo]|nr:hypothetical protein H4582DRAFT_2163084 [Lactarius indigo]
MQSNERGEPLNEEGLPIIEITEPMESAPGPAPTATAGTAPIVDAEDANFIPMYRLPPAQRARNKRREELEQRRANARAELERIKAMKDMQKKMGKALLRNMADAREKEEQEAALRVKEDLELEETRRSRKPRKSVSWAGTAQTTESNPPSPVPADSDEGDELQLPLSDDTGDGDEDEPAEGHASEDEFDIDAVQHQREIALAYFEKRNKIGADAARAFPMTKPDGTKRQASLPEFLYHSSVWLTEMSEQEVPFDATLAGPRPKPPQSKFRSERLAQAYGTHVPSTTPSTSLGTSVLPSSSSALRRAVRTGRLEGDQLVGNGDNDSEEEDEGEDARIGAFMDALRRGEVTNAGAAENSDVLVAALESAYGAPPRPPPAPLAPPATAPTPARQQKDSKFKLARPVAPPRTLVDDEGPREGAEALRPIARPLPISETVLERKRPVPTQVQPPPSLSPAPGVADSPMAIIDSPSFPPPSPAGTAAPIAIVDSPSFPPSRRPTRPPTVLPTSNLVRESAQQQQQQPAGAPTPGP